MSKVISKRFSLNKTDAQDILKVLAWTVASAITVATIDIVNILEVPSQYLWLMPLINTVLVGIKKFIQEKNK